MSFLANWWYRKEKPIWSGIGGDFGFSRYTASQSDAAGGKGIEASGGDEYMWTDPGPGNKYKSHVFNGSGSLVISQKSSNPAYPNNFQYLVVGGGGGAGMYTGGGGGAGGCLANLPSSVYGNQAQGANTIATTGSVTVTVGGGGSGNTSAWYSEDNTNGVNSSITGPMIDNITADGGGRGGNYWHPSPSLPFSYGKDGGSGGGGARTSYPGPAPDRYGDGNQPTAWSPIPQGNPGGGGYSPSPETPGCGGGGGGGWGGAGQAAGPPGSTGSDKIAGAGGIGRMAPAETWGPNLAVGGPGPGDPAPQKGWFGGGGGGGAEKHPGSDATGGQGGGPGAPDTGWAGGGNGGSQNEGSPDAARTAGGTNTGGGGGAGDGGSPVQQQSGANGGSGIVLIRYEIAPDMPTSPFAP